ncbi:hypothetical protein ACVRGE_004614, partial [Escherichia coli]
MKLINNKMMIVANILFFFFIIAALGFIIWRFGDAFGLTEDKGKFFAWLGSIMLFILLRTSWHFSRIYKIRRD